MLSVLAMSLFPSFAVFRYLLNNFFFFKRSSCVVSVISVGGKAYSMAVSSEKSKVIHNSYANTTMRIIMNGQQLESFKYLGATIPTDGRSATEVKFRLATAMSTMLGLNTMWKNEDVSFNTKMKLFKSMVLSIFQYRCESWTLAADLERRIQAFKNKCFHRMLQVS